jgi:protease IV
MSRGWKIALAVVALIVLLYAVILAAVVVAGGAGLSFGAGGSTVAVIRLDGVISADAGGGPLSSSGIDPLRAADLLEEVGEDDRVSAVVLRVNSPGGSPAASWEIYEAIGRMDKPVVVSVGDVAASGAYYFASAADSIVASPHSQVGSIGVILQAVELEELFEKVGIGYTVLTRGRYKDLGAPNRPMTEEERQLLLERLDVIYERFIEDVAEGRPTLELEEVRELATGLTYAGEEAVALGLVDKLGSFEDALDEAAVLGGLDPEDYDVRFVERTRRFSLFDLLLGAGGAGALREVGREMAAGLREGLTAPSGPSLR